MEETQRFLRYVIPGLTFMIELLLYLLVSGNICWNQLMELGKDIGFGVGAFIVSGGLGFLFGVIYYTVVWWECERGPLPKGANHRRLLEEAQSKKWLKLAGPREGEYQQATNLSKRGAWRVVVSYLSTRAKVSKRIEGAVPRLERLDNVMNALGTVYIAALSAFVFFVIYFIHSLCFIHPFRKELCWVLRHLLSFAIGILLIIVHCRNYKGVIEDNESVVQRILRNEFELEYQERIEAIKFHVSQDDLKKDC